MSGAGNRRPIAELCRELVPDLDQVPGMAIKEPVVLEKHGEPPSQYGW